MRCSSIMKSSFARTAMSGFCVTLFGKARCADRRRGAAAITLAVFVNQLLTRRARRSRAEAGYGCGCRAASRAIATASVKSPPTSTSALLGTGSRIISARSARAGESGRRCQGRRRRRDAAQDQRHRSARLPRSTGAARRAARPGRLLAAVNAPRRQGRARSPSSGSIRARRCSRRPSGRAVRSSLPARAAAMRARSAPSASA